MNGKQITRENLFENYQEYKAKIAELTDKKYPVLLTGSRNFGEYGPVYCMDSKNEIVEAMKALISSETANDAALVELGLGSENPEKKETTLYGYTREEWKTDFKNRLEQLKDRAMKMKYIEIAEKLENNLSEDDRFAMSMASISEISDTELNF